MESKSFKFRAECLQDVERFLTVLKSRGSVNISIPSVLPDCYVTIESSSSLKALRAIIRKMPDGHVMLQTIQAADLYTGERNELV